MGLPADLTVITVTSAYPLVNGQAQSGSVVFDPGQPIADAAGKVIFIGSATAYVYNGIMQPVTLPCTDNENTNPTGFTYTVTETIGSSRRSYSIALPHTLGATVDLSALAPVSAAPEASAFASNNTWMGTNTFDGETIVQTPVNAGDAATKAYVDAHAGGGAVASVFGRAGVVVAESGDYTVSQITGALTAADNLSDLASAAAARINLGLGSAATLASSAFDAAGLASSAQTNAETFATNAVSAEEARAINAEALLAPRANPTFTGVVAAPVFSASGLTGATAASRYVGATISGPPTSGTYAVGDWVTDQAAAVWICVTAGTAPIGGQWRRTGDHSHQFRPESYGAITGLFAVHDAVMTSTSSGVLTSASGLFTSNMVGWLVLVNVGAAAANQAPLITTVAQYNSPTSVTLAANPPATAAGNPAIFAPDNTTALQAAWSAAQAYANSSPFRCAEMRLSDLYAMGTAPTKGSTSGPFYGYSLLPITVPDTTGAGSKMQLGIVCERGHGDELGYWEQLIGQFSGSGIVVLEAAPATDATWGIPSVIGGPTLASGTGWSLTGGFANIRLDIDNLKVIVPYNPGWIGIDARYLANLSGTRYGYQAFTVGVLGGGLGPTLGSVPSASWNFNGAGVRFPAMNNNDLCDFGSITCEGVADGVWIADHVTIRTLKCLNNFNALLFDKGSGSGSGFLHGSWIGYASFEANSKLINVSGGNGVTHFPLVISHLDSENSTSTNDVVDSGVLTGLINWYNIQAAVPSVSGTTGIKIVNHRLAPGLWSGAPAVPATTVAVAATALPWRDAMVNIQPNGATITAITVGGTVLTGVTSGFVSVPDIAGTSISLTYTGGTPTWQWWLM